MSPSTTNPTLINWHGTHFRVENKYITTEKNHWMKKIQFIQSFIGHQMKTTIMQPTMKSLYIN
uniref:Uncharacterized protein n=1 Tax=Lepeophtheirus salmonis TaxID=72036 RepID=A0A0K2V7F5_LEPSM